VSYTLYYSPATASQAVHWLLIELGVPFDTVLVDIDKAQQKTPGYLELNPTGHVPTLIVDGVPRAECAALLLMLGERHPAAQLVPAPGSDTREDFLQLMFYLANTLQPALRRWFYAAEVAGADNVAATKTHAQAKIERAWELLDARLQDGRAVMLGSRLSVVDFLATMLTRWSRNMPRPATAYPNLRRYIDRMRQMPSLREVHAREGVKDWIGG
jgi:glutathione S-transferase